MAQDNMIEQLVARIAELEARLSRSEQHVDGEPTMSRRGMLRSLGIGAFSGVVLSALANPNSASAASGTVAGAVKLSAATAVGATTITLSVTPVTVSAKYSWIIIDPFTEECELRKVNDISGTTITLDRPLTYAHAAYDTALWTGEPVFNAAFFGASAINSALDNVEAIQAAITEAKRAGGGVVLLPELYPINDHITLGSNITLMGLGRHTGLRMIAQGSIGRMVKNDAYAATSPSEIDKNISILNMTFDRTSTLAHNGVNLLNVNGLIVDGCWFVGPGNPNVTVGAFTCGGFSTTPTVLGDTCYNVRVTNCYFYQANNFAVQFGSVINGVIANNIAEDCYREVFAVEPINDKPVENIAITGNTVRSGTIGFSAGSATGVIIVTGTTSSTTAYRAKNITVVGNTVTTIPGQVPPLNENNVKNANPGINVLGAVDVTVTGNTVTNMAGAGIAVGSLSHVGLPSVRNIVISANTILDCNQNDNAAGNGAGSGISLRNAQQVSIVGNVIRGVNHKYAVEETGGSANNMIVNNMIVGNLGNFAVLGPTTTVSGNKQVENEVTHRISTGRGTSAQRPSNPSSGEMFWDTTINKPIWWNGTNWKDATGTNV